MKKYDVYLNVSESPYIYEDGKNKFFFSSEFNLRRFIEKLDEFIKEQEQRVKIKFGIEIDLGYYFKVVLYNNIEKRGCRIETLEGVVTNCQLIKFDGVIKTKTN